MQRSQAKPSYSTSPYHRITSALDSMKISDLGDRYADNNNDVDASSRYLDTTETMVSRRKMMLMAKLYQTKLTV